MGTREPSEDIRTRAVPNIRFVFTFRLNSEPNSYSVFGRIVAIGPNMNSVQFLHMPGNIIFSYSLKFFCSLVQVPKNWKGQLLDFMGSVYLLNWNFCLHFKFLMLSIDLFCALFVFGWIVGPIIRIRMNSDDHLFRTALIRTEFWKANFSVEDCW